MFQTTNCCFEPQAPVAVTLIDPDDETHVTIVCADAARGQTQTATVSSAS